MIFPRKNGKKASKNDYENTGEHLAKKTEMIKVHKTTCLPKCDEFRRYLRINTESYQLNFRHSHTFYFFVFSRF